MRIIIAALMLICLTCALNAQDCKCRAPETGAATRAGYFDEIAVEEKTPYKALHGVVNLSDSPSDDVLVELFTHPKKGAKIQRRLKVCLTEADGKFCFTDVPKGDYEVRISKNDGFEITHVYVLLDPNNPKSSDKEMCLMIEVAN